MALPSSESMRAILHEQQVSHGTHDPSLLQFGCDGCPSPAARCIITSWLSQERLDRMINREEGLPRGYVIDSFSAIGKAHACKTNEAGELECENDEALGEALKHTDPFPEIIA